MSGAAGSILGGVLGLGGGAGGGGGASSSSSAHAAAKELSRHLTLLLTEDDVQLLTTLELNRLATYTYHVDSLVAADNDLLETMIMVLQTVMSKPAHYSTVALLKALAVTDWLLTYGADRVLLEAKVLGRPLENLQSYNTVLLAQQSSGATALLMRIKGGGVDQGGPVRAKADRVMRLLSDPAFYQMERAQKSDPGSLVPVGSAQKVGFVTDEVRLHLLRRRMNEEEAKSRIKSNLQKPEGGFGSGYNSRDGKSVVGAAHGIEEMLKMAQKEKNKFADGAPTKGTPVVNAHGDLLPGFAVGGEGGNGATTFSEYRAPSLGDYYHAAEPPPPTYAQAPAASASAPDVDLLNFSSADSSSGAPILGPTAVTTPTASFDEDLLGMSSSILSDPNRGGGADDHSLLSYHPGPLLMDLGAAPSASSDCLMAAASTTSSMSTVVTSNDLLGGSSLGPTNAATATTIAAIRDPFASSGGTHGSAPAPTAAAPTLSGLLGSLSLGRSPASSPYSTPSIDVTPKLPESTTTAAAGMSMMGSVAYPSAPATNAPTTSNHGSFDRFAALDALAGTGPSTGSTGTGLAVGGSSGIGWNPSPYATAGYTANAPAMASTASYPSSSSPAWSNNGSDRGSKSTSDGGGGGGGFVMGGTAGAGLFPLGPAPAAPPPPPPPAGASTFPFY